jgi:TetR/AcrR family transcriptional regulator, regulator of autoinduction and epiphytic fitness
VNGGTQSVEVDAASRATAHQADGRPDLADGRAARSAKTRDAIADALLDLLADGHLRPTAREIAARAEVSLRSVYVHFDDLEDLFCVAARRHYERIAPMLAPTPANGPLAARAQALVLQRVTLYSQTSGIGRATRLHAAFSPTLARILRDAHARSRTDLERVFATELRHRPAAQRENVVAVLDVLTGPDAWETLRERHDLAPESAMRCIVDSIVLHLRAERA